MTIQEILKQVDVVGEYVVSKTTGKKYTVEEFVNNIKSVYGFGVKKCDQLKSALTGTVVKTQSDNSKYVESIMEKYKLTFSDGVYLIGEDVIAQEDLYRFLWKNEKLLPTEADGVLENIERISEPVDLYTNIYVDMQCKYNIRVQDIKPSAYLDSLRLLYPDINWASLLHNILVPNSKPMFHIFYDDGVGGTGKSTLLEVLTMLVGEQNVSNVLLDQFGNRFVFSNMLGKYLNIGDDNGKNDELQNVGTLKSIVTGGRVTIDRKFMQPIECRIRAKQLFATNIMPYIDFTDGGLMRRLNIVPMNKVIPKSMKLPKLDKLELSRILYEATKAGDLEENNNDFAITTSPLYRFYKNSKVKSYSQYKEFCINNGFRVMNIINFETKLKFIENYEKKNQDVLKEITDKEDMPF